MYGLVLEGGGGKGAYQIGVWKALRELNIEIKAVTGTSVGALNGAFIAADLYEEAYTLWENIAPDQVVKTDNEAFKEIITGKFNISNIEKYLNLSADLWKNKGLDTDPLRQLLESNLDEEKIRNSKIDFGLVTVSITDREPVEIFLEDIPQGKLIDYIMASALFPTFKSLEIDGKKFIDGGFYDNLPINLLSRKNIDQIIAVEMNSVGLRQAVKDKNLDITYISPSGDIGTTLHFDASLSQNNIKMGYLDTLKVFGKCSGYKYFIEDAPSIDVIMNELKAFDQKRIKQICEILDINEKPTYRTFFEKALPKMADIYGIEKDDDYDMMEIKVMEYLAEKEGLDRLRIYKYEEFVKMIQDSINQEKIKEGTKSKYKMKDIKEIWNSISGESERIAIGYELFKAIVNDDND